MQGEMAMARSGVGKHRAGEGAYEVKRAWTGEGEPEARVRPGTAFGDAAVGAHVSALDRPKSPLWAIPGRLSGSIA
jgi:hypothetical protein